MFVLCLLVRAGYYVVMELISVRKLSKSGKMSTFSNKFGFEESYVRRWDGAQKLNEMHSTPHRYFHTVLFCQMFWLISLRR